MMYLRSLLFSLGTILATLVVSVGSVFVLPFNEKTRFNYVIRWAWFVMWWLKVTCGIKVRVIGRENLPDSNAILFSNHQSTFETLFVQKLLPIQAWVLKEELLSVPFFGWTLRLTNPIAIDREGGRLAMKQLLTQGKDRLEAGRWVVIFPEGTRVAPDEKGKYAVGGAMLASSTGYPVVPMAHNAGVFWPRKGFLKVPGTITVSIGPAIDTSGMKASAINKAAEAWIEAEKARIMAGEYE